MPNLIQVGPSILAAFLASFVEFVEALTIVLAVGIVRGWRPALIGAAGGALGRHSTAPGAGPRAKAVRCA